MPTGVGAPVDEGGVVHPRMLPLRAGVDDLLDFGRGDVVLGEVRLAPSLQANSRHTGPV